MSRGTKGIKINPFTAKSLLKQRGIALDSMSRGIGCNPNYLQQALYRGMISEQSLQLLKFNYNVDLTAAIESSTKPERTAEEKPRLTDETLKVIEEYSYVRSNDTDRIVKAIQELTAQIKELCEAFK